MKCARDRALTHTTGSSVDDEASVEMKCARDRALTQVQAFPFCIQILVEMKCARDRALTREKPGDPLLSTNCRNEVRPR